MNLQNTKNNIFRPKALILQKLETQITVSSFLPTKTQYKALLAPGP